MVGKPEVIHVEPISNEKSACRQRLPVTAGAIVGTNPTDESIPQSHPVYRVVS